MPSQAQDLGLAARPDGLRVRAKGRLPRGVGSRRRRDPRRRYWTLAPTVLSQPPLMTSAMASWSSSVGKTAAS